VLINHGFIPKGFVSRSKPDCFGLICMFFWHYLFWFSTLFSYLKSTCIDL